MSLQDLDRDTRVLVDIVEQSAADISDKLTEMLFATVAILFLLYRQINDEVTKLSRSVSLWSDNFFNSQKELLLKQFSGELEISRLTQLVDEVVEQERKAFTSDFSSALLSIQALAITLSKGQLPGGGFSAELRKIRARAADHPAKQAEGRIAARVLFQNHLVRIIGRGGRAATYSFDYYVALLAHSAAQRAASSAALAVAKANGVDLVQISPQPSTIGDFCDQYRGKVFSISGTDAFFHPLSVVPNGGCPMHPWCRHFLIPFTGVSSLTVAQLNQLQDIPQSFLELGRRNASANDFQKLWLGS